MAQSFDPRTYKPGGDTLRRFHESTAFTRVLAGPIGAGKTVAAAVAEPFFAAMTQKPDSQGVRSAIVGVLRDNYRNLYATTMKTWLGWVPREFGRYVGSDDRPAVHEFEFDAPFADGKTPGMGKCRLRVEWRALGTHSVEATCRGWELHGAFIDEADTTPVEALSYLAGRVKRGGLKEYRVSRGVWAAFNKPDTDHPLFIRCVEEAGEHQANGFEFFDQPPGVLPGGPPYLVNPAAENLANLDHDYYEVAARGQPEWYVRRMIRNQWGSSVSGEPIFGEPDMDRLFSPVELDPEPGSELSIGADGGGTPAAVIGGRDRFGRRVIYAECVLTDPMDPRGRRILHGVGPKRFAEALGDLINSPRFHGCRFTIGWGDPAAFYGADREMGEYSFMELVSQHLKLPIQPAPSNELELRFEAIRTPMLRINRHTNTPDLVINRSCVWLRRGFAGDYRWAPRNPLEPSKRLKPQKTNSSHAMEAAQYWALGDQGRAAIVAGRAFDQHRPRKSLAGETWAENESGIWTPTRPAAPARGASYSSDWSPWD